MTEVFLLGSFHFGEQDWDIASDALQAEIRSFCKRLLAFRPDAVAVEGADHEQPVIDEAYERVSLADFAHPEIMRTKELGYITMFNQTVPIGWNNESIQLGFRMGKILNLPRVYAVDADMPLDETLLGDQISLISAPLDRLKDYICSHEGSTLIDRFRCCNSPEWSRLNHLIYLQANAINAGGAYNGSAFLSQWYERNLRIFSNLQSLCEHHARILLIYGAGHLQLLRDLINASEEMTLVSLEDVLELSGMDSSIS